MIKPKIAIVAGGTGGHFFPAKALAMQLKERHYPLLFITDKRIEDSHLAEWDNVQQFVVDSAGLAKKSLTHKVHNSFELIKGIFQSRKILNENPVSVIIGFGGYPSIPPLFAAKLFQKKKRPIIILHEGNAIIGKANKLLIPIANAIATSFPKVKNLPKEKITVKETGLPVRFEIENLYGSPYRLPTDKINLLVWGGSLGAKIFNDIVPHALTKLPNFIKQKLSIVQQVRSEDIETVSNFYDRAQIQAQVLPFIDDVAYQLKRTHLIIGRAGGSSIAELSLIKRPAILIPYPFAANDEQYYNAMALQNMGAAWVIKQSQFTVSALTGLLDDLLEHPFKLHQAANSNCLHYPKAAKKLADLIESYI
ncbi:UDP-N-acetylglucosamine--N-acetylmuramyl-(pentapeptide) pyrophosphoryl-undecaprenol N-acetylglucosamine transferase [Commensalibacter sp. Nvir]|uniref:undecaprenyldiphospho-muramoylpentapeptide beta-N-acetylglucosaminyltransferase n=1 Tax=Commensalibacter sp. Nvir TaxID=3069817 RepID=UPI002D629F53|nr:UDP-N-acetylglucosamine--N-acetylmuramyl-(pentapeptide) pyrophosphoryl-undecaprenol N-acetylglucosamine transferase [Commensalibacter sp. Nvir]